MLWDELAEMFLIWCRRGVDGFRCDAGYKVPTPAWQYIIARVQQEFPETIFLLEGLGGSWEATEALLTEGGMQWAYSELFQNYSGKEVAWYLDYAKRQERARRRLRALQRNARQRPAREKRPRVVAAAESLCALTSVERRIWFHMRRRMAGDGKNPRPRQHRPGVGQSAQHRPRTRAAQPIAARPSVLF